MSPLSKKTLSKAEQGVLLSPAVVRIDRSTADYRVECRGHWTMAGIHEVDGVLKQLADEEFQSITIDTGPVLKLDTGGAWLIERLRQKVHQSQRVFTHVDDDERHIELFEVVQSPIEAASQATVSQRTNFFSRFFDGVGRFTTGLGVDLLFCAYLIGSSIQGPQLKTGARGTFRLTSIVHQIDHMGLRAVPVIAVMSLLIGGILAQQGAYQLRYYGEELLTVNLVALLHFREIAVLLTAIMVAGRTGSAITAELGTMKMREEIDALKVMGLNPIGVLIFPRLLALVIVLPILTLLSDIAGMVGAMIVCDLYIGVGPQQFLDALYEGIAPQHVIVGFMKAPIMAMIIGLSAATEGLKVGGSSESLGKHTTASVVRAIFAVIVVDGLFALFFASINY